MKIVLVLIGLLAASLVFAEPTTAPATESLMQGDITFVPPSAWKVDGKSDNGRLAKLSQGVKAIMVVNVDVQTITLPDSAATKIAQQLCKNIRDHAAAGSYELLMQPKAEPDDRFFLRVHHRFKKGPLTGDELQISRVLGLDLVTVAVTAFTDSEEDAKKVFDDAEKMLISVRQGKQPAAGGTSGASSPMKTVTHPATRPTVLPQAQIRFSAPAGWQAETNDNTSGIVATYHDPAENFNIIVISVRPLPKEAKSDPKLRDALVDDIVSGEKAQFKFDGAQVVGDTQVVVDRRFLRKERTRYETANNKIQVTARQLRIGDAVVSVAMAALEPAAADVDKLADEVALTLRR